ncbi:TPX2 (targeting protein for Xklp2) protein family [Zea mays]|uniref:TPX2 (Targeting protein for Xklp2) protein family n=1 Tax=Zea mays TaxID=4577 RepID=A0A1D6ENL8_MAIZE|nr:TPX2 (targeting protein for Xklp2) protein family [Zea mays]
MATRKPRDAANKLCLAIPPVKGALAVLPSVCKLNTIPVMLLINDIMLSGCTRCCIRRQEELSKLTAPGLVAQKKAFFEEYYKRARHLKAQGVLHQAGAAVEENDSSQADELPAAMSEPSTDVESKCQDAHEHGQQACQTFRRRVLALDSSDQEMVLNHGSVSFGRFAAESLSWERRSVFEHNRRQEELSKLKAPGLVAQKKAFFEEY